MPLQETSNYVHAGLFRLVNDCKLDMQIWGNYSGQYNAIIG